jgi:glycosyltransferase involved in cell wall biosynthesis
MNTQSMDSAMRPPKVSICMISYNHGKFIAQAIESILAQEVDFSIELVIGDDCSKDDTGRICEDFARRDPRVRLLPRERNLGVMPNFARTLAACVGEYVAVCEGDDYWMDPRKLAKQAAFLDTRPDHAGAAHQSDVLVDEKFSRKFKLDVPHTLDTMDLLAGRQFHTASVIFRRPAVDLFCRAPLVLSCDRLLNFCISFLGKIHYSEEAMCAYRLHGGGMSSNVTVAQLKLDLSCIDYLQSLQPSFPRNRYRSYVYATIGLCRLATPAQKLGYMALSFLFSFANFPHNLGLYGTHLARAIGRRLSRA